MQLDVEDLRDFYTSPLGQVARRLLSQQVRARWRGQRGGTLAGLGFGTPFLGAFRNEVEHTVALMPESQGAIVWPLPERVLVTLVEDHHLPLADSSVDLFLLAHCLEHTERTRPLLREIWRVLAPEGRLIVMVPNRRGVWARFDRTPFGHGRPYSRSQIEKLLLDALFTPLDWSGALHVPPLDWRLLLRSAVAWERLGTRFWPAFGGVLIVEARKELQAPTGKKMRKARAVRGLVTVR